MISSRETAILLDLEPDMRIQHQGGMSWTEREWLRPVKVKGEKELTGKEKDEFNERIIKFYGL